MKIEYGQRVRVTRTGDGMEHLEDLELWLDDYNSELGYFVDGSPNPDGDKSNDNEDFGWVEAVEPVEPRRFVDRERYFKDGVRKSVLRLAPESAAQDGHVEEEHDEENTTCSCGYPSSHEPPERFPVGSRVVIKRAVWTEDAEGGVGTVERNDDSQVFITREGERVPHPYQVRFDLTGGIIWAASVELADESEEDEEAAETSAPPRPRPVFRDPNTGELVDERWVFERAVDHGYVEVLVEPAEPIHVTLTTEDLAASAERLGFLDRLTVAHPSLAQGAPVREAEDVVNHPSHYTNNPAGVECIDVVEWMSFCRGNAVKYLWRAGHKDPAKEIEDLEKAAWYVNREIDRLRRTQS